VLKRDFLTGLTPWIPTRTYTQNIHTSNYLGGGMVLGCRAQLPAPSSQLPVPPYPYPCALFQGVPRPRASVHIILVLNFRSLPDRLLTQGCKALHRQPCSQQWFSTSADEETHGARAAGAGAGNCCFARVSVTSPPKPCARRISRT
jgi:hypothetical protein